MIKGLLSLLGASAPLPYFLDEYSNGFAAYSLKRLSSVDECVTVLRDSDNAELTFNFVNNSPNSGINESDLLSWLSGSTGYIKQFYDLSGNGNHLIQTDKAKMFKIAESGSVFTENGNLAARCDTGEYRVTFSSPVTQPVSAIQVHRLDTGITSVKQIFDNTNGGFLLSYFRYASVGS